MNTFQDKAIETIKQIPKGTVTTYGTVAALAGSPRSARTVGQILRHQSEARRLPWQRVINAKGYLSIVNIDCPAELQAALLREEGVVVTEENGLFLVDLAKYGWQFEQRQLHLSS